MSRRTRTNFLLVTVTFVTTLAIAWCTRAHAVSGCASAYDLPMTATSMIVDGVAMPPPMVATGSGGKFRSTHGPFGLELQVYTWCNPAQQETCIITVKRSP